MLVVFLKSTVNTKIVISHSFICNYLNFKRKNWNNIDVVITLDILIKFTLDIVNGL
jgi:hypothetical protein